MNKRKPASMHIPILMIALVVIIIGIMGIHKIVRQSSGSILPTLSPSPIISTPITISGKILCLPHTNQDGPQTMECAYGLMDNAGTYYGIHDADPGMKNISTIQMNQTVQVTGTFRTEKNEKYPTVGVIEIQSVTNQ